MKVCIVDDEEPSRRWLRQLLSGCPDVELCGEGAGFSDLERIWQAVPPDVVFLDIEMAGMDGVRVAESLPGPAMVVFVTAHPDYAVRAFELGATDYLVKPVTAERLRRTLERCRALRSAKQIWVGRGRRVLMREISAIVSGGTYSTLLLADGERIDEWKSLREWEKELTGDGFIRISRTALVNSGRITAIERGQHGWEVILEGACLRFVVSRRRWRLVREALSLCSTAEADSLAGDNGRDFKRLD